MYYLGIDIGSVSTDFVLLDQNMEVADEQYLKTNGAPIEAVRRGLETWGKVYDDKQIRATGITGSARHIGAYIAGGDVVKNEITAHAVAALKADPAVRAIIEIGGQDSKIIVLCGGVVVDFAMNTVCAAGTGSFLDRQAERMQIPIEQFGDYALAATLPVRIAGRCSVFAESDMIHKQAMGFGESDIIAGLCEALVRNYLVNVAKGKVIEDTVFFQGGVAANKGMKAAFEKALGRKVVVPGHYHVMGAVGAAILAGEAGVGRTAFRGFKTAESTFASRSFECAGCANCCEVVSILQDGGTVVGRFGDKCGKWSQADALKTGNLGS